MDWLETDDLVVHIEDDLRNGEHKMTVMGYNIDPDGDEACIGVELDETGVNACIYIDNAHHQEEMCLNEKELRAFIAHCRETLSQIHWNMASWIHASQPVGKTHLMRKGDDPHGKALCGALPTHWGNSSDDRYSWSIEPVLGNPEISNICKSCMKSWTKLNK